MAGDEHQFAVARAGLAPLQVMRRLRGLAVLVGAEQADVEVEARVLEVVRVAAEEGDLLFGREDQPDVGVFLVAVEVILAALVEGDHVAAQAGLVERLLFDGGHDRAAGLEGGFVRQAGRDRGVHARGDILDAHQHVQLEAGQGFSSARVRA